MIEAARYNTSDTFMSGRSECAAKCRTTTGGDLRSSVICSNTLPMPMPTIGSAMISHLPCHAFLDVDGFHPCGCHCSLGPPRGACFHGFDPDG